MSGNRGFRRTANTPGAYKSDPGGRVHTYDKPFIGFVRDNKDAIRMGRLRVWIPELAPNLDDSDEKAWYTVNYCSPFAGATRPLNLPNDDTQGQNSYGWWAVPPDLDNEVVVMFINGDPNRGIWVGSLYQQYMNHMVPGVATGKSNEEGEGGHNPPVVEYNKKTQAGNDPQPTRPRFGPLHEGLRNEGLYDDGVRGRSTASARRKDDYDPTLGPDFSGEISSTPDDGEGDAPPALVYGLKSPRGSHFYIDDAGEGVIRLRTANGAQVLINDEVGYVYMISRNGNSWMQVSDDGIDMYSAKSISIRAHEDINFHADGNINQYAAGSLNQVGQGGGTGSFHGGYNMLTDQLNLTSAGSVNIYSPTRVSISGPSVGIAASENIGITAGGQLGITSSGEMALVGSKIKQNSGKGPQAKVEPIQQSGGSGGSGGGGGSTGSGGSGSFGGPSGTGAGGSTAAVPPPTASGGLREDQAMRWFMSRAGGGYTRAQAAGIVGNLKVESSASINHRISGDGGRAYGIAQWRDDRASGNRQGEFRRVYGKSIKSSSYEEQLAFVTWELANVGYLGDARLRRTTSAADAAQVFMEAYERPSSNPNVNHVARRRGFAQALASKEIPDLEPGTTGATQEQETASDGSPTTGGANESGPQVAPQPQEPSDSGTDIAEPIEASAPRPSGLNDRELNVDAQYPLCQTYTIVSRLPTHEPFEGHPTGETGPVQAGLGSGSVGSDYEGGDGEYVEPENQLPIEDNGGWYYPVSGLGGSPYGMRTHPVRGGRRMHHGCDVRQTPTGTPIYAAKSGTVIFSGVRGGYGKTVIIRHESGTTSLYGHCSQLNVRQNQEVKAGDQIARVGSTGMSTGPHLHFEIRNRSGGSINPKSVLPNMKRGGRMTGRRPA